MNMTANPADLRPCWLRDVSKRVKVAARLRQPVCSSAEARIGDMARQGLDSLAKMRNAQEIVTIGKQLFLLPRQLTDVLEHQRLTPTREPPANAVEQGRRSLFRYHLRRQHSPTLERQELTTASAVSARRSSCYHRREVEE
jgi:hypothetical protein